MKRLFALILALALLPGCGASPSSAPAQTVTSSPSREEPAPDPLPRLVRVDGVLYRDTGRESPLTARCGTMDGEITSQVEAGQQPEEDGQSNFGTGFGYQFTGEGVVELFLEDKWMVFRQWDPQTVTFHGKEYPAGSLSEETLDWLALYNLLPQEEQLAMSYIPGDLLELAGISGGEEAAVTDASGSQP